MGCVSLVLYILCTQAVKNLVLATKRKENLFFGLCGGNHRNSWYFWRWFVYNLCFNDRFRWVNDQ